MLYGLVRAVTDRQRRRRLGYFYRTDCGFPEATYDRHDWRQFLHAGVRIVLGRGDGLTGAAFATIPESGVGLPAACADSPGSMWLSPNTRLAPFPVSWIVRSCSLSSLTGGQPEVYEAAKAFSAQRQ